MVLEYVQKAWETYKENAMSFIVAELIVLVITGIIILMGIGAIFGFVGISALMGMTSLQSIISRITSIIPLLVGLGTVSIFLIIAGVVWILLKTGIYGMAAEALRGKTKVKTMLSIAKSKGLTGILACIIVGILAFFMFLLLIVGLTVIIPLSGFIIGTIVFGLVMILFSLTFPGIILDNLNALESIKVSASIVRRNYLETLGLILIYIALSIVLTFIPVIGSLIIAFVISPMFGISLMIFYKKRK